MTRILTVTASPNGAQSLAAGLARRLAEKLDPAATITVRDLAAEPPGHLDQATIGAFYTPDDQRTDDQRDLLAASDTYVAELEAADVIILAVPMHNFSIPSVLKAWIDQIARVGRTFRYTEQGPEGLLKDKPVYVIAARGGDYGATGRLAALDHQVPFLKTVLGFVGVDDVTFINAEGVAMGEDGIHAAEADIDALARAA